MPDQGVFDAACDNCTAITLTATYCLGLCWGIVDADDLQDRVDSWADLHRDKLERMAAGWDSMKHHGRWRPVDTAQLTGGFL